MSIDGMIDRLKESLYVQTPVIYQLIQLRDQLNLQLPAIGIKYYPDTNFVYSLGDYSKLPINTPFITMHSTDEELENLADYLNGGKI